MPNTFDNYKKWAITQRITELMSALRNFPNSPFKEKRERELENLKKDLEDLK